MDLLKMCGKVKTCCPLSGGLMVIYHGTICKKNTLIKQTQEEEPFGGSEPFNYSHPMKFSICRDIYNPAKLR